MKYVFIKPVSSNNELILFNGCVNIKLDLILSFLEWKFNLIVRIFIL